jgi:hypothetical protein
VPPSAHAALARTHGNDVLYAWHHPLRALNLVGNNILRYFGNWIFNSKLLQSRLHSGLHALCRKTSRITELNFHGDAARVVSFHALEHFP